MCSVVPIILEKSLMFITLQECSVKSTQNFTIFFTITPQMQNYCFTLLARNLPQTCNSCTLHRDHDIIHNLLITFHFIWELNFPMVDPCLVKAELFYIENLPNLGLLQCGMESSFWIQQKLLFFREKIMVL